MSTEKRLVPRRELLDAITFALDGVEDLRAAAQAQGLEQTEVLLGQASDALLAAHTSV
jgi:hypothetical protein